MLEGLLEGEATVDELANPLPISQPAVSKDLKILETAGLGEHRRDATRRWASIRCARLKEVLCWTSEFQRLWDARFARLDQVLEDETRKERGRR